MSNSMLDASAILAVLNQEEGAEKVMSLEAPAVSAVNLAEVATKLSQKGVPEPEMRRVVALLDLEVIPFDERAAYRAGGLHPLTSKSGLSLGDRACLATAALMKVPAVTAERSWRSLKVGVPIQLIR